MARKIHLPSDIYNIEKLNIMEPLWLPTPAPPQHGEGIKAQRRLSDTN